mgnify:CR=1 FL=1
MYRSVCNSEHVRVYSVLHTVYSVPNTAYCIPYTEYSVLHTEYRVLHTVYRIQKTGGEGPLGVYGVLYTHNDRNRYFRSVNHFVITRLPKSLHIWGTSIHNVCRKYKHIEYSSTNKGFSGRFSLF